MHFCNISIHIFFSFKHFFIVCWNFSSEWYWRIRQNTAKSTDSDLSWSSITSITIFWLIVYSTFYICSGSFSVDSDVTFFSPTWSPRVSNDPIIFSIFNSVSYSGNSVIDSWSTFSVEDSRTIGFPSISSDWNSNWSLSGNSSH